MPDTGKSAIGLDGNLAAALGYPIGILAIICLIMDKENKFVKFHALQSALLYVALIAVWIALVVLSIILGVVGIAASATGSAGSALGSIIGLLWTLVWLAVFLAAFIPIISPPSNAYALQYFNL